MTLDEAREWLQGERSWWNLHAGFSFANEAERSAIHAHAAEHDAAMSQQAYWMLRGHKEGLAGDSARKE
jgi:hypothetical protein